jgi:hypothetical protein
MFEITQLVALGANRILSLPRGAAVPRRIYIYCPEVEAEAATMGLVASLVRHVNAETTLVSVVDEAASRADRTSAFRRLLDARAESRSAHGLDLRTEVHMGAPAAQMRALLTGRDPGLLVIGTSGSPGDVERTLARDFGWIFAKETQCPAFIVHSSPRVTLAEAL